jgi:hypothetical protein
VVEDAAAGEASVLEDTDAVAVGVVDEVVEEAWKTIPFEEATVLGWGKRALKRWI